MDMLKCIACSNSEDRIEELADMLEIIGALANLENKNLDDVIAIADKKMKNVVLLKKKFFLKKLLKLNKKIYGIIKIEARKNSK